jgi:hypothetical protein
MFLNGFLKGVPAPVMRIIRRRNPKAPIEEFVFIGRRSRAARRIRASGRYFRLTPIDGK